MWFEGVVRGVTVRRVRWFGVNICMCLRVSERMRSVFFSVLLKTGTRERIGIRKRERNECCVGERKEVGRVF